MYVLLKMRYSPTAHQWDEDTERIWAVEPHPTFDAAVDAAHEYTANAAVGWGDPTWRIYCPNQTHYVCPNNLAHYDHEVTVLNSEDFVAVVEAAKALIAGGHYITTIRAVRMKYDLGLKDVKEWADSIRDGLSDEFLVEQLQLIAEKARLRRAGLAQFESTIRPKWAQEV